MMSFGSIECYQCGVQLAKQVYTAEFKQFKSKVHICSQACMQAFNQQQMHIEIEKLHKFKPIKESPVKKVADKVEKKRKE